MERSKLAVKSSMIGITSQIINLIAKFLVRTIAIRYLGLEILGLDSVLIDTISMLSLAEMGITSAMLYRLYKPVINREEEEIRTWMATYRMIYRVIAVVIAILGVVLSCFLPIIIKDISVSWTQIYLSFYLQLIGSVSSYLLAYKRILLNADQKKHICILVDMAATVVFSVARAIVMIIYKNYQLYLIIAIIQTICSNLFISIYAKNKYPFVDKKAKPRKADIKNLMEDAKHVLGNKLAGYIYGSTDNLIISFFLGTGMVGLLSNYKFISAALRSMVNSVMATIQPIIGNYLNTDVSKAVSYETLKKYNFVRYVIAGATTVPFVILADLFVKIWTGKESYVMSMSITLLLAFDYYIGCTYGSLGEYASGVGYFKFLKYSSVVGAVANIVLSLIGVRFLGCVGVLGATVISQFVIWIGNGYILFKKYYFAEPEFLVDYIKTQLVYFILLIVSIGISLEIMNHLNMVEDKLLFVLGAFISEVVYGFLLIIFQHRTKEFSYASRLLLNCLKKNKNM